MLHTDVIIIGSGPAGCAAAICCKLQGLAVVMVAGKAQPACDEEQQAWESIHPGVISVLQQLNAAHCVDIASQGVYEGIEAGGVYNALGADAEGKWQGYQVNRVLFDAALLQCAKQQGVSVIANEMVAEITTTNDRATGVVTKTGTRVSGKYIIDASGQRRIAGKKLGFNEVFHSPQLVAWTGVSKGIPDDAGLFQQSRNRFIPHTSGWTWLAPGMNGHCAWTMLSGKVKLQFLPPDELQAYTLCSAIKVVNRRWRVFRPVCKEGVLLCGEAAAIIDPAAGQGILHALVSAGMAANTVQACFKAPDFEALYLVRYDEWFFNDYMHKVKRLREFYAMHDIGVLDTMQHV